MLRHPLPIALLATLSLPADAGKKVPPPEFVPPTTNFQLRGTFDTDPSVYLGRFIPDDALVPDEAAARKTACSQYLDVREVGGGGVEYDEVFEASQAVALGFGLPQSDLQLGGKSGQSASLRARYTLSRKLVADISDPVAFASCCRQSPTECTTRFVGEFMEGSGEIWAARSSSTSGNVLKTLSKMGLDIEANRGQLWARSRKFPQPVYFAFAVTEVPEVDCKALVNNPPKSDKGLYFGAVSEPLPSEKTARDMALASAREQAVKYLGEAIATGSLSTTSIGGDAGAASAKFQDEQFVKRAAEGVARFVKDELTCIDKGPGGDGPTYTARTLAFMPTDAMNEAAEAALGSNIVKGLQ